MKTLRKLFLLIAVIAPLALVAQDRLLTNSEIPSAIKTYAAKHFPAQKIVKAELDRDGMSKEYEIKLDNGTELKFNGKGKIVKIESKSALPASVIPTKIADYVKMNYPKNAIIEWELDGRRQEVKLNNGVELKFTKAGKFVKRDL